jgi:glucokinase
MEVRGRVRAGIDIGGTKVVAVLAGEGGEVLREVRLEDWRLGSWERDLAVLADAVVQLADDAHLALTDIASLGVSVAGPLDPISGVVLDPPNLAGWRNVPLRSFLEEGLGVPVRVENDANAGALAEWRFGAGRGTHNLVFLTMSTGVGGGLILEDRLYRGARFQAGEIGHMPVVPDGRQCACGLRGCLEAYTGGAALAARLREDAERGEAEGIRELAGGDPEAMTPRTWVEAIRRQDPYALALRDEYADHLSRGIAILVMTLDLERVVLGTIVQNNPDLFLAPLREQLRERVWSSHREAEVRAGELGLRLPAYAALCVAELEPLSS